MVLTSVLQQLSQGLSPQHAMTRTWIHLLLEVPGALELEGSTGTWCWIEASIVMFLRVHNVSTGAWCWLEESIDLILLCCIFNHAFFTAYNFNSLLFVHNIHI